MVKTPAMPMPTASQNKNPLEPFLLLSDCDRPPRMNHAESTPTMTTATPSNFQASQGMFSLFPVYLPYPRYRHYRCYALRSILEARQATPFHQSDP